MDFNLFGNGQSGQGNRIADYFKGYAGYFNPENIRESLGELGDNTEGALLSGLDGAIKSVKAPVDFVNMVSGGRLQGASDFFQRGSDAANALKPDSVRQAENQPLITRDPQGNRQFHLPNAQQLADFTATALPQIPQFIAAGGGARSLITKGADYLPGLAAEMTRLAPILGYGAAGAAEGSGNMYSDVSRQARDQALATGASPEAAEIYGRDEGSRAAQAIAPFAFAANALGMGGGSQAARTAGNAITGLFRAAGQNALAQFGQGGVQSGVEDMALGHGLDWDSILNNGYTSAMLGLPFGAAAGAYEISRPQASIKPDGPPISPNSDEQPGYSKKREEPRKLGMPENAASIISEFKDDAPLKAHPDYKAAKSGDLQAALRLTGDLITSERIAQAKEKFQPGTIFVPVIGKEASGHNQIPHAMALQYARGTNGIVDDGIVQSNEAYHTGARPLERMLYPALFEGNVRPGRNYVLIDDVATMGNTIQELANHIRSGGGNVTGAVTLVNASRTGDNLSADPKTVRDVEGRFGNEVREIFGVEPSALSNSEARYLLNFKNADALRASSIAAVRERQLRLAAKGISGFKTPEE